MTALKYDRCGRLETHALHDFTVPASITTTAATYTCLGHVEVTEAERPTGDTSQFGAWVGAGWDPFYRADLPAESIDDVLAVGNDWDRQAVHRENARENRERRS